MRNQTSDLRIPRFDALPLSHRDSTVSEVFYEVHTARISNVDSVMFVKEIKMFLSSCHDRGNFFAAVLFKQNIAGSWE